VVAVSFEDDEQHEHDIDQRHDVDLRKRRRDTSRPRAAPPAVPALDGLNFRHLSPCLPPRAGGYVKFLSAMLRNSSAKSSISVANTFTRFAK